MQKLCKGDFSKFKTVDRALKELCFIYNVRPLSPPWRQPTRMLVHAKCGPSSLMHASHGIGKLKRMEKEREFTKEADLHSFVSPNICN